MSPSSMFRPCIDLHEGLVKQIVGGSLTANHNDLIENHVSPRAPEYFAEIYRRDGLRGGHVIKLGPGNDAAAHRALQAYPDGLQIGGGITPENASRWLEAGAEKVIVTSCLFDDSGHFQESRLDHLVSVIGKDRLVIDLSCRRSGESWYVAIHRWQVITDLCLDHPTLEELANRASEFLIHAADVEGLCGGFDAELVNLLATWGKLPMTYAGGIAHMADVFEFNRLSQGRLDFTVGSALDLFGGCGIRYEELVEWNRRGT